ncbi:hypothetical protein [Aquitalea palustris]|uniref:hypothetical protein n=1 Tax=Aquitalea palustris TaxID=2480983 RepID=UPI001CF09FB5|nr:hypothetical protein [Aquitalea palustris]
MNPTTPLPPSTIAAHPDYPFIRTGLTFDFQPALHDLDPAEHVVDPSEWAMEIAGTLQGCTYYTREAALAEGKGRAQGGREAKKQFAEALAKADRVLAPYR